MSVFEKILSQLKDSDKVVEVNATDFEFLKSYREEFPVEDDKTKRHLFHLLTNDRQVLLGAGPTFHEVFSFFGEFPFDTPVSLWAQFDAVIARNFDGVYTMDADRFVLGLSKLCKDEDSVVFLTASENVYDVNVLSEKLLKFFGYVQVQKEDGCLFAFCKERKDASHKSVFDDPDKGMDLR